MLDNESSREYAEHLVDEVMNGRMTRRQLLVRGSVFGMSATAIGSVLAACGSSSASTPSSSTSSSVAALDTLTPGVLVVSIEPYYPYCAIQGGKLVGLDSDVISAIAQKLDLKVKPVTSDFAGQLAAVQSHRVDVAIGSISWSAERAKVGLFTDPDYYSPVVLAEASGKSYTTIDSLKGLTIGTISGYVWTQSIPEIPGATLKAYPTPATLMDDLGAGRIAVAMLDPLISLYTQKTRPDLHITTSYLQPPTAAQIAAHPIYTNLRGTQTAFYIPKQEPKLEQAVSAQIDAMYKDGSLAALVTKYGGDPKQFLIPGSWLSAQRQGADRPSNWTAPSIG